MKLFSTLFVLLFVVSSAVAQSSGPGDYDGDGKSDLAAVTINRSASPGTSWVVEKSSDRQLATVTFTKPGDALVTGQFFAGDSRVYPGIVFVESLAVPLNWYVKNNQGSETFVYYGLAGDTIPNQGDFDCDGVTDLTVVREGSEGLKHWFIALSGSGGAILETTFGLREDKPFVADVDGDHCAELLVLRPSQYNWFNRDLYGSETAPVQWGLPGDIPLLPQDVNGDSIPDYIISRKTGGIQIAYVRFSGSSASTVNLGLSTSVPMVGKFGSATGFAWFQRDAGLVGVQRDAATPDVYAFGSSTAVIVRPDGTVIQPSETGIIPASAAAETTAPSGSCSTPRFPDGSGGALWKPFREGGGGSGDATFLIPSSGGSLTSSVVIYGSSGQVVHRMKLRYHGGPGNRSVWDATVKNSTMSPSAPLTIRATFGNGSCQDRTISNPNNRYD